MAAIKLNRRAVLRAAGLSSLAIGLPVLESMLNSKGALHYPLHAQSVAAPKKLIMFHWPQGVQTGFGPDAGPWFPAEAGPGWSMTAGLKPMEPYRNDFNLVSGACYGPLEKHVGSHGHAASVFTGYRPQDKEAAGSNPIASNISIDQFAGARMPSSKLPSLVTSLYENGEGWWSWVRGGANGYTQGPQIFTPRKLFDSVFLGENINPDEAARLAMRDISILNHVTDDIKALKKVLGSRDQQTLDQHLTQISELEKSVQAPYSASCVLPSQPANDNGQVPYSLEQQDEYAHLMIDLCVFALRCNLTRVALISLGGSQSARTFPSLGVTIPYHDVCHGPYPIEQRRALYAKITQWHMEQLAYLFNQLRTPDTTTGETLLDSSVFVALSEFSSGETHYANELPIIVAGKAGVTGNAAMKTGSNLVFPCPNPDGNKDNDWIYPDWCQYKTNGPKRCINDVWQSALTALGILSPNEIWGDPTIGTTPLPGLWA